MVLGQTKSQSSASDLKNDSFNKDHLFADDIKKNETKMELSSSMSRNKRTSAYLPRFIWGSMQPAPKERVTWRIPAGKSTKQVTWYINSGHTSETLFRLWSKKANQGHDSYQSYCVYFNRQPLPYPDAKCHDIFYTTVSWGRVVGPKNETGIVPIPKSEKRYPPKEDCNHVLQEAEFKVKSFVKPVSLWRIPLYPYDKQRSIIENGDGTERLGTDYTLLVPGIPKLTHS